MARHLENYTPEKARAITGIHPDVVRGLARRIAAGRTTIMMSWNTAKIYHGDLYERAMSLVLGLIANWGRHGSGIGSWTGFGASSMLFLRAINDVEAMDDVLLRMSAELQEEDPDITVERATLLSLKKGYAERVGGVSMNDWKALWSFWYYHCGYDKVWNNQEWSDPTQPKPFDEMVKEAMDKGWWPKASVASPDKPPRVYFPLFTNVLRTRRGGQKLYLENLWPKLKMVVATEVRMSTTALWADIVLPAATHYEKYEVWVMPPEASVLQPISQPAHTPMGEAKAEWEIFGLILKKFKERAQERGLSDYVIESWGDPAETKSYDEPYQFYSFDGEIPETELRKVLELNFTDLTRAGIYDEGTTLDSVLEKGWVRASALSYDFMGITTATDILPDETLVALTWHTEKKIPYPTLTGRAQFYIDHEWWFTAGEVLPVHKEAPQIGGNYPLQITSGHGRHSIHNIMVTNPKSLALHRGEPEAFLSVEDAKARGLADGDYIRAYNDFGEFVVRVKVSSGVRPGQLIVYHLWEPYMYKTGKALNSAAVGMVKWTKLAGGYGHIDYLPWNWQPTPVDRHWRVEVEKYRETV